MRIRSASVYAVVRPLDGRTFNAAMHWKRKDVVLVRLITDSGIEGWGECWTFDEEPTALIAFIRSEVLPHVLGSADPDPREIHRSLFSSTRLSGRFGIMASAISGVDIALWDILAKSRDAPLAALLRMERERIPVYASGGLYRQDGTLEALYREFAEYAACGYRRFKMKIGGAAFEEDRRRVATVRDAIGPNGELIVDATYSLSLDIGRKWIPVWHAYDVSTIQAPLPPGHWQDLRRLADESGLQVMGFEAECRKEILLHLAEIGALGIIQFSPIAAGGISGALELLEGAERLGAPVSLQVSSSGVAAMAALQLGATSRAVQHVEYHQFHTLFYERMPDSVTRVYEGVVRLSGSAGLGMAPPEAALPAPVVCLGVQ